MPQPTLPADIGGGQTALPASSSSPTSRADHFHSTQKWIAAGRSQRRRTTTLAFVLPQSGRVLFTVTQVSPMCAGIGRFRVAGHAGLNRVRLARVVHGRRLTPGTYRVAIRTASGQIVRRVTLVVVTGSAPSGEELHALRAANVCGSESSPATRSNGAAPSAPLGAQPLPQPKTAALGLASTHAPDIHSGVLASNIEKTARAIQPLLVFLLALAIVLLAVASLPREAVPGPRVHDTLARHRLELAGLGAGALLAVALAVFLT